MVLLLSAGFASAQTSGVASGVGTGTGQASSGLNYAPVSTYEASTPKPNTVIAPSINPTVSCANSGSAGLAFGGVQIVGGGSHVDEDCSKKELIKMTYAMGDPVSAFDMECDAFPSYRATRMRQGKPCIQDTKDYKDKQSALESSAVVAEVKGYMGNDPLVLARMTNK